MVSVAAAVVAVDAVPKPTPNPERGALDWPLKRLASGLIIAVFFGCIYTIYPLAATGCPGEDD